MNAPIVRMRCPIVELCKFMLCAVFGFGLKFYFVKFTFLYFSVSTHFVLPYWKEIAPRICVFISQKVFSLAGGGALVKHNCAKRVISTLPSTGICTMTICTRHSVKWFPIGRGRTCCSRRLAEGIQSFSYGENPMKRDALSRNPARVHVGWRLDNHAHGLPYERDISSAHSSFGR